MVVSALAGNAAVDYKAGTGRLLETLTYPPLGGSPQSGTGKKNKGSKGALMPFCPKCKKLVETPGALFCSEDGCKLIQGLLCPNCGKENFLKNRRCSACRSKLVDLSDEDTTKVEKKTAGKWLSLKKVIFLSVCCLIVVIVAVLGFYWGWNIKEEKANEEVTPPPSPGSHASNVSSHAPKRGEEEAKRAVEEQSVREENRGKEYVDMVLIDAGEFQVGSEEGEEDEKPVHTVYLDAYYIDKHEVTNAQYVQFLNAVGRNQSSKGFEYLDLNAKACMIEISDGKYRAKPGYENYPVIFVSWYGARDYADWAGKRLPTEAEWEKAARGGLKNNRYPWGDSIDESFANYDATGNREWGVESALRYLKPVGSFSQNGYGLYDMAGNVLEWCVDCYDKNYYQSSPQRNPTGPSTGDLRVQRGGSWDGNQDDQRCANREKDLPYRKYDNVGFRCALSLK
jgi:formylglycine-generating enzyme required for sulfatase activity